MLVLSPSGMVLTRHRTLSLAAASAGAAELVVSEACTQTDLLAAEASPAGLKLQGVPEAEGHLFCRCVAVVKKLCCHVKKLWEEISRLISIHEDE